jgi:hypothetical protein
VNALRRRLEKLERIVEPAVPQVTALALRTGTGDLMFRDGKWIACPDVDVALASDGPLKVYAGFDPREVVACPHLN